MSEQGVFPVMYHGGGDRIPEELLSLPPGHGQSWLYFIDAGTRSDKPGTILLKVGITGMQPRTRISSLQQACPMKLTPVMLALCGPQLTAYEIEQACIANWRRFGWHESGEWFSVPEWFLLNKASGAIALGGDCRRVMNAFHAMLTRIPEDLT